MGWIIVNKDVLAELNWLFELQSRSGDKWRKDGHESLSEGKQIERKMKKNCCGAVDTAIASYTSYRTAVGAT